MAAASCPGPHGGNDSARPDAPFPTRGGMGTVLVHGPCVATVPTVLDRAVPRCFGVTIPRHFFPEKGVMPGPRMIANSCP